MYLFKVGSQIKFADQDIISIPYNFINLFLKRSALVQNSQKNDFSMKILK